MQIGTYVIVRTYSAGVHCGELVRQQGKEVTLKNTRRVWYWEDAFTLNAIANSGVGTGSKISVPATEIDLTEAIEIIACSDTARAILVAFPAFEP